MSMKKFTKAEQAERDEALARLRDLLPPDTVVRTILRHTTSSGMSRSISCVTVGTDGSITDIDWLIARARLGYSFDDRRGGLKVGGAGMDMGFHLVYTLSRALYPDGYECSGRDGFGKNRCGSNDHSNYRSSEESGPNYLPGKHHSDGGYALHQEWL